MQPQFARFAASVWRIVPPRTPKGPQGPPKAPQGPPKDPGGLPKGPPRDPTDSPRTPPGTPKTPKTPRTSPGLPKDPPGLQRTPQSGPWDLMPTNPEPPDSRPPVAKGVGGMREALTIYLKVESAVSTNSYNFDFNGRFFLKVEERVFT